MVRHEIDYKRPALGGETLIARTWLGEVTAATCERFCDILRSVDGPPLAKVRTLWCIFNPASGRPRRIDPRKQAFFDGP